MIPSERLRSGMTEVEKDETHHEDTRYGRRQSTEEDVGEYFGRVVRTGDVETRRYAVLASNQRRANVDQCAVLQVLENLRA